MCQNFGQMKNDEISVNGILGKWKLYQIKFRTNEYDVWQKLLKNSIKWNLTQRKMPNYDYLQKKYFLFR